LQQKSEDLSSIKNEIKKKQQRLYYITHPEIKERHKKYSKKTQKVQNARKVLKYFHDPEYRQKEIKRVIAQQQFRNTLKGLCHKCFASYVHIEVIKGIPLCKDCVTDE
jgi:hypothetical protein